jgi:hypothetical protein
MPAVPVAVPSLPSPRRCSRRAVAAIAVLCAPLIGTAALASPATAAPRCAPADGLRSATLDRRQHADGTAEVTEYLTRGAFRVTRCGPDGRPRISQTVSPILDPDGGITLVPTERQEPGLTVSLLYGDPAEPSWAADFRANRAAVQAATATPAAAPTAPPAGATADAAPVAPDVLAAPAAAVTTAAATAAADTCTNAQYSVWSGIWTARVYGYRINRSRFNYNDTTVTSLGRGHTNWDTTFNSCGLNDITNLASYYLGSTASTIHTSRDGESVTDRGDMAAIGCPGALACTMNFTDGTGATTESDQRFNEDTTFSNVGASGAYDFQSVATHETGHTIGLGHANSSDALTMFYAIGAGETQARSLAKGDVMGLRARYP